MTNPIRTPQRIISIVIALLLCCVTTAAWAVSPDGSLINSPDVGGGGSLVTNDGATWTWGNSAAYQQNYFIKRNGAQVGTNVAQTLWIQNGGNIYARDSHNGWITWNGSALVDTAFPIPAVTSQVHNAPGWIHSHSYTTGARVNNGPGWNEGTGKFVPYSLLRAYQLISGSCTTAGSGGPTGTASDITDGTCHWKYLSDTDYVSITGFANDGPVWTAKAFIYGEIALANDGGGILSTYQQTNPSGCTSSISPVAPSTADGCTWTKYGQVTYTSGAHPYIPWQVYVNTGTANQAFNVPYVASLWNDREYLLGSNGENDSNTTILQGHHSTLNHTVNTGYPFECNSVGYVAGINNCYINIVAAPGESFADYLAAHPSAALTGYDQSRGVGIKGTFNISDTPVNFKRLQFFNASGQAFFTHGRDWFDSSIENSIIEVGTSGASVGNAAVNGGNMLNYSNDLIIAHGPGAMGAFNVYVGSVEHSTIVNPEGTGLAGIQRSFNWFWSQGMIINNTVVAGFAHFTAAPTPIPNPADPNSDGGVTFSSTANNMTTSPSPNPNTGYPNYAAPDPSTGFTALFGVDSLTHYDYPVTNTVYSVSPTGLFMGPNDYRIPPTSPLHGAGANFGPVNICPEGGDPVVGAVHWPCPFNFDNPDIQGATRPATGQDIGAIQTGATVLTTQTLTASKLGTGSGTITSSPAGINCGSTCQATFNTNDSVTLTAAPTTGSSFTGWGGNCSSFLLTCPLTMDSNKNVTASFTTLTQPNPPHRAGKIRNKSVPSAPVGPLQMPPGITGTTTVDVGTGPDVIHLVMGNNYNSVTANGDPFNQFDVTVNNGVTDILVTGTMMVTSVPQLDGNGNCCTGASWWQHFYLRGNWGPSINKIKIRILSTAPRSGNPTDVWMGDLGNTYAGAYYNNTEYFQYSVNASQPPPGNTVYNNNGVPLAWTPCLPFDCLPNYTATETVVTGIKVNGSTVGPDTLKNISVASPANSTILLPAGTIVGGTGYIGGATTIQGTSRATTIIDDLGDASNHSNFLPSNFKGIFDVSHSGITLKDMTIRGAKIGGYGNPGLNAGSIFTECYGFTADNLELTMSQDGVRGGGWCDGLPITISNSYIHDNGSRNGFTHEIYIADAVTANFTNNTVVSGERSTHALKSRAHTSVVSGGSYSGCLDPSGTMCGGVMDFPDGGNVSISNATVIIPANAQLNNNGSVVFDYAVEDSNAGIFPVVTDGLAIQNLSANPPRIITYGLATQLNLTNCTYTGSDRPHFFGWFQVRGQCYPVSGKPVGNSPDGTVSNAPGGAQLVTLDGTWTWGGATGGDTFTLLNGVQKGAGVLMEVAGGQLYVKNSTNVWYEWVGPDEVQFIGVLADPLATWCTPIVAGTCHP